MIFRFSFPVDFFSELDCVANKKSFQVGKNLFQVNRRSEIARNYYLITAYSTHFE